MSAWPHECFMWLRLARNVDSHSGLHIGFGGQGMWVIAASRKWMRKKCVSCAMSQSKKSIFGVSTLNNVFWTAYALRGWTHGIRNQNSRSKYVSEMITLYGRFTQHHRLVRQWTAWAQCCFWAIAKFCSPPSLCRWNVGWLMMIGRFDCHVRNNIRSG